MTTIEEIRAADDYGVEYHEHTRVRGYRFVKRSCAVVIERSEETEFRHIASRMITPFRDLANEYDIASPERTGKVSNNEWDRRRRMLATTIDKWLDGLGLRTDRKDAHRWWSGDKTPHLICRYSNAFQKTVSGSNGIPPMKFLALGRGFQPDHGIAVIGNVITDDTLEDLARKCAIAGMGINDPDLTPDQCSFLIMDLDRPSIEEGAFSTFQTAIEDTFRLW